jgi:hypothetical protein
MKLSEEFFSIAARLRMDGVRFCVIGGVALSFHDNPRFTRDIDLLVQPEDMNSLHEAMESLGYFPSSQPMAFPETGTVLHRYMKTAGEDSLLVDILTADTPRLQAVVTGSILTESEHGPVPVASRQDLIWLKQQRNSDQDQVDIRRLSRDQD